MAASFNDPKVTNPILSDISEIQELFTYLAQARPDLGLNYPANSVRIYQYDSANDYWAIQVYRNGSWQNMGRFFNNVRQLQGYEPSTSAAAGKIPVYNSSGQLVGNISGNAASATKLATPRSIQVGGILSSTAQNFDGSANVTIPVNQITINNAADNAVNGTLTAAHGGTGRTDGAAQDVVVSSLAGTVKAKGYGQIGTAVIKGDVDLNTLTVDGRYLIQLASGQVHNQPLITTSQRGMLTVKTAGTWVYQTLESHWCSWLRFSADSGASWYNWRACEGTGFSPVIYISKSGSDNNTGLESAYPVLSFNRAFEIADALATGLTLNQVNFCIGAGNWGRVNIGGKSYRIMIFPYDGAVPTAYSASLPVFDSIYAYQTVVFAYGIIANQITAQHNSCFQIGYGFKRIGHITASDFSQVVLQSQNEATNILELSTSDGVAIFASGCSNIYIAGYLHIKIVSNNTITYGFIHISQGCSFNFIQSYLAFDTSSYVWTGPKWYIPSGATVNTGANNIDLANLNRFPGTQNAFIEAGAIINGFCYSGALDSAVVHKTGDTLTGNLVIERAKPCYIGKSTVNQYNVTPTEANAVFAPLAWDKNGVQVGALYFEHNTTGDMRAILQVKGQDNVSSYAYLTRTPAGVTVFHCPTPSASYNNTAAATTAWVRSLLASNSANEVPIGSILYYDGSLTRAVDAIAFYAREIEKLEQELQNEQNAQRMLRMTRDAQDPSSEQTMQIQEMDGEIFKTAFLLEFYKEMATRLPENDGARLYNEKGDLISDEVNFPEFNINGRAFPNTKWQEYTDAAGRFIIGKSTDYALNATGGAATHYHTFSAGKSTGEFTITQSETVSHHHSVSGTTPTSGNVSYLRYGSYIGFWDNNPGTAMSANSGNYGNTKAHSHSLSGISTPSANNLPLYKALILIKKIA